ncbi:MAG: molybdopterin-dependent oxidoreductase, partial [Myxococcota bacterium]|nr:molybdopterin-dependent oxidoreductase [Myxococcota bacterium]
MTLSTLLPGCPNDPVEPPLASGDADTDSQTPAWDAETQATDMAASVDKGPSPQEVNPTDATKAPSDVSNSCESWDGDPNGTGSDAYPWVSQPPPPGADEIAPITANEDFYVTSYFGVANVEACDWNLEIAIRGEVAASIDLNTLLSISSQQREHTLQCVESAPDLSKMDNAMWTGVPLTELLNILEVTLDNEVTGFRLLGADGYEVGLPMEDLQSPIWLVWEMNGTPIPPEHGFPVRLICPDRYGWQNVKQLVGIDFIEGDPVPEYQQGWATHYRLQGLIANAESIAVSPSGQSIRLLGKAYAGSDPVTWVGISTDGGETYQDAEFTYAPGPDRWAL